MCHYSVVGGGFEGERATRILKTLYQNHLRQVISNHTCQLLHSPQAIRGRDCFSRRPEQQGGPALRCFRRPPIVPDTPRTGCLPCFPTAATSASTPNTTCHPQGFRGAAAPLLPVSSPQQGVGVISAPPPAMGRAKPWASESHWLGHSILMHLHRRLLSLWPVRVSRSLHVCLC